jgi:hypothetical protein
MALLQNHSSGPGRRSVERNQSDSPDTYCTVQKSKLDAFARITAEISDKVVLVGSQKGLWCFGPGCVALRRPWE